MPLQNPNSTLGDRILLHIACFCCWYCFLFLSARFYLAIEIRHDPNRWYVFCECLLWLLGIEASEL